MENKSNHPRRSSGRGILEVHPTQLRRGNGAGLNPEQLHIIDTNPKQRTNEKAKRTDSSFTIDKKENTQQVKTPVKNTYNDDVRRIRTESVYARKNSEAVRKVNSTENILNNGTLLTTEKAGVQGKRTESAVKSGAVKTEFVRNSSQEPSVARIVPPSAKENSAADIKSIGAESTPAQNEKRARDIVNVILCGVFALAVLTGAVMSVIHMADKDKPTYSEFEKRELEKMPALSLSELASGDYTDAFDRYFSDNFPLRESLVKGATSLKRFKGIRAFKKDAKQLIHGDDDIYSDGNLEITVDEEKFNDAQKIEIPGLEAEGEQEISENAVTDIPSTYEEDDGKSQESNVIPDNTNISDGKTANESVSSSNESYESDSKEEVQAPTGSKLDTIYIIGDTAYEYFRGSTKSANDYINVINTYAKYIPDGVDIYTLVIPTHPEFGLKGADRSVSNEQKPVLEYIGSNLDSRVTFVNPHSRLLAAYEAGEYLYYRTDHHWTIRGAYEAYCEFCEKAGITPVPSEQYETGKVEPFLGTFYGASKQEPALAANPDYVEYFVIDTPCTVTRYDKNNTASKGSLFYRKVRGEANAYLAFMGGDFPYVNIKTENTNGKKLMIFKESFANPLIGLLAPHYEEIHVADIRYFKYNSVNFINQYGITDVLFCNGIMSANSKARVNDLMNLMNK